MSPDGKCLALDAPRDYAPNGNMNFEKKEWYKPARLPDRLVSFGEKSFRMNEGR